MKENVGPKIIVAVVILIMLMPIFMDAFTNSVLKTINYDSLTKTVDGTANYDFALVYVAPSSDKDIKAQKSEVKEIVGNENYKSVSTGKSLQAYYLDSTKLSEEEYEDIFEENSQEDTAYMFIVNGEVTKVVEGSLNKSELVDYVEFYSANGESIPEDMIHYNVPEDSKEFSKLVKDKNKVTMFVLGRDNCFYCNQFKIVYSTVAEEYDLDSIYYIDSNSFDSEEYNKIMDFGLTIPAECSDTGEEIKLQAGFNTPLILYTKNGKTIDCSKGYSNKANLITKLKTVGIIEEEK